MKPYAVFGQENPVQRCRSRIYRKVEKDLREVGKYLLKRWKQFNSTRDSKAAAHAA